MKAPDKLLLAAAAALLVAVAARVTMRTGFDPASGAERLVDTDAARLAAFGDAPGRAHHILILTDFVCRACAAADSAIRAINPRSSGWEVSVRYTPLSGSPSSVSAARIAICADLSGSGEQMRGRLFRERLRLSEALSEIGKESTGVDSLGTFARCADSDAVTSRLQSDIRLGNTLGATVTPTIVVDDLLFRGYPIDMADRLDLLRKRDVRSPISN
jgi:protein-disulfide isomerase